MERIARYAPVLLLVAAQVTVLVVTLIWASKLTFYADTWELLMNRRDPTLHALLEPHNEHLILFPVLIEQALLRLFGMGSAMPEYVLLAVLLVATSGLLYVYVKRRVGPWLAAFAAILVLTLGPAWEVLLWPFEITFVGPVLCGLAALLALEREDRWGDLAACVLLVVGLGFSSLGVPFAIGAGVAILVGPREAWLRRAYVVAVPAALFVVWYLGWGSDAGSSMTMGNVLSSPRFVADEVAAAAGAVFQFRGNPLNQVGDLFWGRVMAVVICAAIAYRVWRGPRSFPGLWPVLAAAGSSWFLTAFNDAAGRSPTASRYLYAGGIFVLLILANVFQGVRLSRPALVVAALLTALAVAINFNVLESGNRILKRQAALTRADLGALEIAGQTVDPGLQLNPEIGGTPVLINVFAGPYLQAASEYGSPAYSPAEIAAAGPGTRRWADETLAAALPVTVTTHPRGADAGSGVCVALSPGSELAVGPGLTRVALSPGPDATLELRRFGGDARPPVEFDARGGAVTVLRIPADGLQLPWRLGLEASQPARVCRS